VSSKLNKSAFSLPFVAGFRRRFKELFRTPAESALLDCSARERRRECLTCRLSRFESPRELSDLRDGKLVRIPARATTFFGLVLVEDLEEEDDGRSGAYDYNVSICRPAGFEITDHDC